MHTYSQCPVCKSTDFKTVFKAKDHTVSQELFSIAHCAHCSFRFTNPVPGQAEIGPYYKSEAYVSHTNTSRGLVNRLYQIVRKRTLKSKRKLLVSSTGLSQGTHLDIGAGAGAFVDEMRQHQWQVTGMEPDEDARAVAQKDFGVGLQPIEDFFSLTTNQFDAISMWHVLEHVHQLDEYMQQMHQLLKEKGRLFIAVPNYTSHDAKKYGRAWAAYDVPRHLYHFSPDAMRHLLERHGFKLLEMKRMPYDSFYVSMLSEKHRGGNLLSAMWNGFCSWWVAAFNLERCSSLIYVIEKA